jgi:two-component system cell cycle sensor histidine kinase/response regulator CckA
LESARSAWSDGSEFPVEISPSLLETEDGTLVMSAIRDITERKHAQAERERLEQRLRQAEKMEGCRSSAF